MSHDERRPGERLVFVGGAPRSGTTLLQNVLDSHPDVAGGPEFDDVPSIVALRDRMLDAIRRGRTDVFASPARVDRLVGEMIEGLLLPFADARGKRLLSEKTPSNVRVFAQLLEIFPEARFVFCIRDPRAVIASLRGVGRRARGEGAEAPSLTQNLHEAIALVKRENALGMAASRAAPARVHVVRYERLVVGPEETTRELCTFLGLPWSSRMIEPDRVEHAGARAVDGVWYSHAEFRRPIDRGSLERWRVELSGLEAALVEAALSGDPDLREAGYELGARGSRWASRGYEALARARDLSRRAAERIERGVRRLASGSP